MVNAAKQQVARTIQYYRNEALTYKELCPKSYRLTARQRQRILKYGLPLGAAIKDVITICGNWFCAWPGRPAGVTREFSVK